MAIIIGMLFLNPANAGKIFDITITDPGTLNTTLLEEAIVLVENEVLNKIPNTDRTTFFNSMANANAMAGKDLGTDPINKIDYAMVVLGAGAAIDLDDKNFKDLKDSTGDYDYSSAPGAGIQLGLGLGTNGKYLPKKYFKGEKWSTFVNFMPYKYDKDDLLIKIMSAGAHMRYQISKEREVIGWSMLTLEPVFLSFGLEFSRLQIKYAKDFNISQSVSGTSYSASFNATGNLDVTTSTYSIPFEISSGIRLLYLVTLYGGLGVDINTGNSKGTGSLTNSAVSITDGSSTATGTASLNLGEDGEPKVLFSRGFLGLQFNLWNFKIFAQGQKTFGRNLYGVQTGLKYFF